MSKKDYTITTILDEYPLCDFCLLEYNLKRTAYYDGRTIFGAWAYMCENHFLEYGVGLGLGKGQKIIIEKKEK